MIDNINDKYHDDNDNNNESDDNNDNDDKNDDYDNDDYDNDNDNDNDDNEALKENVKTTNRLSKVISSTGICSRRQAEKIIEEGRVLVNGVITKSPATQCDLTNDDIVLDGVRLERKKGFVERPRLWMVHKISGELVADKDPKNRPLLLDRLKPLLKTIKESNPLPQKTNFYNDENNAIMNILKPVNRLEFHMEGMILFTNNGLLARLMDHKSSNLVKKFRVRVHGLINESKIQGLRKGIISNGVKYPPLDIKVDRVSKSTISWITVSCLDYHRKAITTSLQTVHIKPLRIISTELGPYKIGDLPRGAWKEITLSKEIQTLLRKVKGGLMRI